MKNVSDKGILARIKEIRTKKGFSQEYVGTRLSLEQSGYALIENGRNGLSVLRLLQIAIILEESIVDLVGYPFKYIKEEEVDRRLNVLIKEIETKDDLVRLYKEIQLHDKEDLKIANEKIDKLEQKITELKTKKNAAENSKIDL